MKSVIHNMLQAQHSSSFSGLIGSCIAMFVIAVLYEFLKSNKSHQVKCNQRKSETSPLLHHSNENQSRYLEIKLVLSPKIRRLGVKYCIFLTNLCNPNLSYNQVIYV